jgi:hypothetical protein
VWLGTLVEEVTILVGGTPAPMHLDPRAVTDHGAQNGG